MLKKYYFLSGLPRAGNTIISAILNQNKDIGVSANSLVAETLYKLDLWKASDVAFKNFPDEGSYDSMMSGILPSYYSQWDQKYIIDRSGWGTPDNLQLLKRYCPNEIRIVCLVRDVSDVIRSWIDWSNRNPDNYLNKDTNNGSIEEKSEYLLHPHRQLIRSILSVNNLIQVGHDHLIVDYDDFVNNPHQEIDRIYNFLDIPSYNHDLTSIKQFKMNGVEYDDSILGKDLHKIRTNEIVKREYNVDLPLNVIETCQGLNIWL